MWHLHNWYDFPSYHWIDRSQITRNKVPCVNTKSLFPVVSSKYMQVTRHLSRHHLQPHSSIMYLKLQHKLSLSQLILSKLYHTNPISVTMRAEQLLCLMCNAESSRTFLSPSKNVIPHFAARGTVNSCQMWNEKFMFLSYKANGITTNQIIKPYRYMHTQ